MTPDTDDGTGLRGGLMEVARLRWQCRRGMRELDVLLTNYLEQAYPGSTEQEKAAFQRLLALPDPQLIAYLLNAETTADEELGDVIGRIRRGDSA